jgi:Acetyltransferase (GNAT) domain
VAAAQSSLVGVRQGMSLDIRWVASDELETLREWDEFLLRSPRGHSTLFSTWLRSYEAYGFDFGVVVARDGTDGPIVGGVGMMIFGNKLFKLMSAPIGPIVDIGHDDDAQEIVDAAVEHADAAGASLLQLQFPCSDEASLPALLPSDALRAPERARPGVAFDVGNAPHQLLWVGFPEGIEDDGAWREAMFRSFSPQTRNKIRIGERQQLEVYDAVTEEELREAYVIMEAEAKQRGAAFRSWSSFGAVLTEQVASGQGLVVALRHEGRVVAARYGLLAGCRFSYISGARVPVEKLKTGQLLTWAIMERLRARGLVGYDFSSIGDPGVMAFKNGFGVEHIPLVQPTYVVFSTRRVKTFLSVYPTLRRHKRLVSAALLKTFG